MADILKYLIYITLFLFPLGELTRFSFSNSIAFRLEDIGVACIALLSVLQIKRYKNNELLRPVLIFFFCGTISLVLNRNLSLEQFLISLSYSLRWISYTFIYFTISSFDKKIKINICRILIIIGGIVDLIGIIQYIWYQNLRNLFYLGWDDHLYRLFSSFLDPNFSGSFYVLYFLLLLGIVRKQVQKNNKYQKLLIGLIILTLGSIFLTYSRSALLMFLTGTSSFFILTGKKKWMLVTFFGVVVFIITISPFFYIENINIFRTVSSNARLDSIKNALTIIKDNPIFGIGFNAYRYAQISHGFRGGRGAIISHADAGTDNSFLFVLATTGIVGLTSFLYILFKIIKRAFRLSSKQTVMPLVVISSFVGLFVDSLFVNSLFFPPIMLWMWIIAGVMDYT